MESLLKNIDNLHQTLVSLQPIPADQQQKLDEKFRLEFNYNSNHLEGNTLTYGETRLLLLFDGTTGNHNVREYQEMQAHDVAWGLVKTWAKQPDHQLIEKDIKELNAIILVKPFLKPAITLDRKPTQKLIQIGSYKTEPNSVIKPDGTIFEYASVNDTPILMGELMKWYREEATKLHPAKAAALFHYKFVCIHPFDDGNGRISRLLLNYSLLKAGFPPVVIKSVDKQRYLNALHLADGDCKVGIQGDSSALMYYIYEQLHWSLGLSVKAAKAESLEETDDYIKQIELIRRKALGVEQKKELSPIKNPEVFCAVFKLFLELSKQLQAVTSNFKKLFNSYEGEYYLIDDPKQGQDKKSPPTNIGNIFQNTEDLRRFSQNLEQYSPHAIVLKQTLRGLKGLEKGKYEIFLRLDLDIRHYKLSLWVNLHGLYSFQKPYSDLVIFQQTEGLLQKFKQALLTDIDKKLSSK